VHNPFTITALSINDRGRVAKNDGVELTPEERKRIGGLLKGLRTGQHLKQLETAERAGISPGTLQTIEWGARKNSEENIEKLARALGTSLEVLRGKPNLDPTDPLPKGLNREDLEIARAYHEDSSHVRDHARGLLRDRDPQAPSEPTTDEIAAMAALIARLSDERRQLVLDLVHQLERLEDRNNKAG
jgi:transcriptional regulator with XRE-family HTH domain